MYSTYHPTQYQVYPAIHLTSCTTMYHLAPSLHNRVLFLSLPLVSSISLIHLSTSLNTHISHTCCELLLCPHHAITYQNPFLTSLSFTLISLSLVSSFTFVNIDIVGPMMIIMYHMMKPRWANRQRPHTRESCSFVGGPPSLIPRYLLPIYISHECHLFPSLDHLTSDIYYHHLNAFIDPFFTLYYHLLIV